MAKKIADTLDVSLDYLVGSSSVLLKGKKMAYRLEFLDKISEEDCKTILKALNRLLKKAQTATLDKRLR